MQLIYIIAPYTAATHAKTAQNISEAKDLALYCWTKGYAVLCPHLNSSFMSGIIPEEQFYLGTIKMLSRCDIAIAHPRYHEATGCLAELAYAKEHSIPAIILNDKEHQAIIAKLKAYFKELK